MTAVMVELGPRPATVDDDSTELQLVEDLDVLSASDMCSCSAGDNNPY
ncbi:hypothetical protein [Pseudofrankia sp. BMG5.36]|nr:hypothetical protein [Pseudofrankia sp. BMG5.36]